MPRSAPAVVLALGLASLGLAPAVPAAPLPPPEVAIRSLGFLTGRWRGETWDATYSTPEGGKILSFAKEYAKDGAVGFFEYERIEVLDGRVVLTPAPFGRPSVRFPLVRFDPVAQKATFQNLRHDFPTSITYWRVSPARLRFVLTGVRDGKPVREVTDLRRATPGS